MVLACDTLQDMVDRVSVVSLRFPSSLAMKEVYVAMKHVLRLITMRCKFNFTFCKECTTPSHRGSVMTYDVK